MLKNETWQSSQLCPGILILLLIIRISLKNFLMIILVSGKTWFRDYLYIPMGGSRVSVWRIYFNLCTVFLLCGLWHGASWNFLIWGALHGVYLVAERIGIGKLLQRLWKPFRYVYTMLLVMTGWVFFRTDDLSHAVQYLSVLLKKSNTGDSIYSVHMYLNMKIITILCFAILLSTPIARVFGEKCLACLQHTRLKLVQGTVCAVYYCLLCLLFLISVSCLAAGAYNPFIYFRF
ncbi:MAG: hypothetical protein GY795_12920 [Desulfobacterales bacterium]|nr:hypothetical protein [Desulfobacterales bacterium]